MKAPTAESARRIECIDHYASIAESILRTLETSDNADVRATSAEILSRLWERRQLHSGIKDRIAERYFSAALLQLLFNDGRLELQVVGRTTFPFPIVPFAVRFMQYRNGKPESGPHTGGGVSRLAPSLMLTSHGAVRYTRGDVYVYDIVLDEQSGKEIVWRKVFRTNALAVQ